MSDASTVVQSSLWSVKNEIILLSILEEKIKKGTTKLSIDELKDYFYSTNTKIAMIAIHRHHKHRKRVQDLSGTNASYEVYLDLNL